MTMRSLVLVLVLVLGVAVSAACSAVVARAGAQHTGATVPAHVESTRPRARDCVRQPSRCGYPDATVTGPDPTTDLRVVEGQVVLDHPGEVLEDVEVHGGVDVTADDVVIRNVRILQSGESWGIGLQHVRGTRIEDCQITSTGARLLVGIKDVYGDATATTISRCDISRASTGIQVYDGLVEGCYVHDLAMIGGDHLNGITSNGGSGQLTVRRNTILNPLGQTDAIGLFQDFGVEANRTITGNLLAGGGYTIYAGSGDKGLTHGVVITDNRFARVYHRDSGTYGPGAAFDVDGRGNVWADNYWDDDLSEVPVP